MERSWTWLLVVCGLALAACGGKDKAGEADAPMTQSDATDAPRGEEAGSGEVAALDVCVPHCEGKECGDDGCGGVCQCAEGYECRLADDGSPVCFSFELDCPGVCEEWGVISGGVMCGPVWSGLDPDEPDCECGDCPEGDVCVEGGEMGSVCCAPDCNGKECGPDGCGGSCGECWYTDQCSSDGICVCVPDCGGDGLPSCGDDGCGGYCGECPEGENCNEEGKCGEPAFGTLIIELDLFLGEVDDCLLTEDPLDPAPAPPASEVLGDVNRFSLRVWTQTPTSDSDPPSFDSLGQYGCLALGQGSIKLMDLKASETTFILFEGYSDDMCSDSVLHASRGGVNVTANETTGPVRLYVCTSLNWP